MSDLKIIVGSANPAKVGAVEELVQEYPQLAGASVTSLEVSSGVAEQPKSLEEIIKGASGRAEAAYQDCTYGVGLESGFMAVPGTASGYMNVCAAAVFDGKAIHLGLSSAFETPDPEMMRLVIEDGMAFDQAAVAVGFTEDPHIGRSDGIVGVLTHGKVDRKEYSKEALRMAFVHIA